MTQKFDFEKALKRLEQIALSLEDTDIGLEKALELFEEGIRLTKQCTKKLEEAEKKITKLIKDESGELKEVPAPELENLAGLEQESEGTDEEKNEELF